MRERLTFERELAELVQRERELPAKGATVVGPFPETPYALALTTGDAAFNRCAAALAGDAATRTLAGAVVDLTGNPAAPCYFGQHDGAMLYVGSLAKIYALYAAFELKARVQKQAKAMIATGLSTKVPGWEAKVFAALRRDWQPRLNAAFPKLPPGFPQLGQIVTLSKSGDAALAARHPAVTDAELDARPGGISPEYRAPIGRFRDWLRQMLRWSSNAAAGRCIRALSYPYLNGALAAAGLFDVKTRAGLWISGDYMGNDWLRNDAAGQPLAAEWAKAQGRRSSNFTGTASQVARLMTLMARGRLVDAASSTEMLSLMTGDDGIGSYVAQALWKATPPRRYDLARSKIGYGNDRSSHDCALIEMKRTDRAKPPIRHVSVVLGAMRGRTALQRLAVGYHDCVVARHP